MSTFCEQELFLKNFWFHHKRPVIFVTSQIGPHALYPAWLTVQVVYHIVVLAVDGLQTGNDDGRPRGNYFLYLANWAYLVLVLSSIIDLASTLYVHCLARYLLDERKTELANVDLTMRNRTVKLSYKTMGQFYRMKGYLKVSWIFFTMSCVVGITVTLLNATLDILGEFSSVKYNLLGVRIGEDVWDFGYLAFSYFNSAWDFGSLAFNYFNTVVILIHLLVSAKPFRLLHFYLPVVFFAVYMIFSLIYQQYSDKSIYKILDWDQVFPTTGIAYSVVFSLIPLVHLFVFGLVQARVKVGTWCQIRYRFSRWKQMKIRPAEPEVDPQTNVLRWLGSNRREMSENLSFTTTSPSKATLPRSETMITLSQ